MCRERDPTICALPWLWLRCGPGPGCGLPLSRTPRQPLYILHSQINTSTSPFEHHSRQSDDISIHQQQPNANPPASPFLHSLRPAPVSKSRRAWPPIRPACFTVSRASHVSTATPNNLDQNRVRFRVLEDQLRLPNKLQCVLRGSRGCCNRGDTQPPATRSDQRRSVIRGSETNAEDRNSIRSPGHSCLH